MSWRKDLVHHVRITVRHTDAQLRVEIDDDGVGGAQIVASGGLESLTDRVAAADGELVLCSPPGAGTHHLAFLPTGTNEPASESSTPTDTGTRPQ